MYEYNSIAESNNFIVLDKYEKNASCLRETSTYQTEASLENEFIQDLVKQGYEYLPDLTTPEAMFENARVQLQILNDVQLSLSDDDDKKSFHWNHQTLYLNHNSHLHSFPAYTLFSSC